MPPIAAPAGDRRGWYNRTMRVACLVALVVAALLAPATAGASSLGAASKYDFGDAPDGRNAGGVKGKFPSLLASNGARAADSAYAFLGARATVESDSLQTNRDRRDDGVTITRLASCTISEAVVTVNLPTHGMPARGTGYVNIMFDWNRNGQWKGKDRRCSGKRVPEWAIKNKKINLSNQASEQKAYRIRFPAGRLTGPIWYRAILSVDEPWKNQSGAGGFERGEVEDYLLKPVGRGPLSWGRCGANPRPIVHGTAGEIGISRGLFSFFIPPSDELDSVVVHRLTKGRKSPTRAVDASREIKKAGVVRQALTGSRIHRFTYRSKLVHTGGKALVNDWVWFRARFRSGKTLVFPCKVVVFHDAPAFGGGNGSSDPGDGNGTLPSCELAGPLQLTAQFFAAGVLRVESLIRAELQTPRIGVPVPGQAQLAIIDPGFKVENSVDVHIDQQGKAILQRLDPLAGEYTVRGRLDGNCVEQRVTVPG